MVSKMSDFSVLEQQIKLREQQLNLNFCDLNKALEEEELSEQTLELTLEDKDLDEISTHSDDRFSDCHGIDSSDEEHDAPTVKKQRTEEDNILENKKKAHKEKLKGNKLVQEKQWKEAIAPYSCAISLYDKDPIYYANRAVCYMKLMHYEQAEADCTKAIQLDYKYDKAYMRRAAARKALGNVEGACSDLQSILVLEPNNTAIKEEFNSLRATVLEMLRKDGLLPHSEHENS